MKKVAIIILNFKVKEDTCRCIESVQNSDYKNLQIIVVNNSFDDELEEEIKNFKDVLFIQNKENLGFTGGNNVGVKYALLSGADYIFILNPDTLIDKDCISALIKTVNVGDILGPKIYFANSKKIWYAGGILDKLNVIGKHRGVDEIDKAQYENTEETDYVSGAAMFVKRKVFDSVGLFDEKYFLYYEDADLSERVKNAGYKIIYAPAAIIWHKNAGSAGGSGSRLQDYYTTRNRLLFGMEYASLRAKIALIKESLKLLFLGRYWQKKGVADFYLKRFQKGSFNFN